MPRLAERIAGLTGSPVREMLAVSQRPDMISFAGGLPAPETFAEVDLSGMPRDLLQYGPSEGELALRARIAEELAGLGLDCGADRVLVLSGSQQGIDLAAKLAVEPGTAVAVESPAYLAALQVFRLFGARLQPLEWSVPPALAYVTPTFQNPTGRCWSAAERAALAAACDRDEVILFEDDPYRDLAYDPCERRPVASLLERASWIYQGSFSKTLAPGLRLGFMAASEDLFAHLARLKQAADLHANRISQWIALRHLEDPGRQGRMERIVTHYRDRRDRFAEALERHLGNKASWTAPAGGLFFWVELDADPDALLERALERGVLFTPGRHFVADASPCRAIRLNFSLETPERAERGLEILGELLRAA